jgi:hypothetical protein
MADLNSAVISATPPISGSGGAELKEKSAFYGFDGTQSNNDVVRFFRISSGALVKSLLLTCDAITGMSDVNFGLHRTVDEGGAAVDDNVFDDAQTLASVLVDQQKRYGGNSARQIETINQRVWELLGLSADPMLTYDVTATLIAAGTAGGVGSELYAVLRMQYQD